MAVAEGTAVTDIEHFVGQDGRDEEVARVRELIELEKVQYVYYQYPSVTGRIMGKGAPAEQWERMAERGFQLVYGSTANLFIDRHGNYIGYGPEAFGLLTSGGVMANFMGMALARDIHLGRVLGAGRPPRGGDDLLGVAWVVLLRNGQSF